MEMGGGNRERTDYVRAFLATRWAVVVVVRRFSDVADGRHGWYSEQCCGGRSSKASETSGAWSWQVTESSQERASVVVVSKR